MPPPSRGWSGPPTPRSSRSRRRRTSTPVPGTTPTGTRTAGTATATELSPRRVDHRRMAVRQAPPFVDDQLLRVSAERTRGRVPDHPEPALSACVWPPEPARGEEDGVLFSDPCGDGSRLGGDQPGPL